MKQESSKNSVFSKKGSYIVFITMLFSGILILIMTVLHFSREIAISSSADSLSQLWTNSILSEYDIFLDERYGIKAFVSDEYTAEKKLAKYTAYTADSLEYVHIDEITVFLDDYSLLNGNNFVKSVNSSVLNLRMPKTASFCVSGENVTSITDINENRYIANQSILMSLPSNRTIFSDDISDSLLSSLSLEKYIFTFFKSNTVDRDLKETYFSNEIEYIISGKPDDKRSLESVRTKLVFHRNALNMAFLLKSKDKQAEALAAAELLTPGPAAELTKLAILETWAFLESENDVDLLLGGKRVPLNKTDLNWALSIENALSEFSGSESSSDIDQGDTSKDSRRYIEPPVVSGLDYEGYLKILLAEIAENTKVLRIMDLIQINAKYLYSGSFLISDYYIGLDTEIKVNGKIHMLSKEYE